MKISYLEYSPTLRRVFKISVFTYFLISFLFFFFFSQEGKGDESLFINDLIFIQRHGWVAAIEKSISIPYMILAYPFSIFFKEFVALRLVNFFLIIILLYYFLKIVKIKIIDFYLYLFFFLATSTVFFIGTNDALFFTGIIIFITEVFYFIEDKKMNNDVVAFSALILAFFTRELFLVYIPVVLLGLYFIYKNGYIFRNKKLIFPVILAVFFMVANIPSLKMNHKLSFDNKSAPSNMTVNWSQRQYLAQLLVNKGESENFSHPSWEQTQEYLNKNGSNSLPNGIVESLTFDYSLTFKEFFKDFYYSMFFGFRQLGLILFIPFYFLIINLKRKEFLKNEMYVPYSTFLMLFIFSFIIISYIELRWLVAVFIVSIVFYSKYQEQKKINLKIISVNYFIMICFSLLGIYGLVNRLISYY